MKLLYCFIFRNIIRDMLQNMQYNTMTKWEVYFKKEYFIQNWSKSLCQNKEPTLFILQKIFFWTNITPNL